MEDSQTAEYSHDEVFLTAVLFETALAVLAVILGWALGPSARAMIPEWDPSDLGPIVSGLLYGAAAAIPILVMIEIVRRIPWEPIQQLERLADSGMLRVLLELRATELTVISICAGVGEELLFRGWLMYWIWQAAAAVVAPDLAMTVALLVSSVVFGLFHPITPLYIVLASLMGVYFGALVIWSGNLLVPIMAHATYDAVQLILTARSQRRHPA